MPKLDTVKSWVDANLVDGLVKPFFTARVATDNNWIFNATADGNFAPVFPAYNYPVKAAVMMNSVSPGMRIPGVLTWNVSESSDNITNTATIECLNSLPVSKTTTTLTSELLQRLYNPTIFYNIVRDANGVLALVGGNVPIWKNWDPAAPSAAHYFREESLVNRVVAGETFTVSGTTGFPDPRVPYEEWVDETGGQLWPGQYWTGSTTGAGAYFIQIGNEVIRITDWDGGSTFTIPPGGRAVNGVLEYHPPGATITLLGFPPYTGRWVAPGYLTPDDYRPYKAIIKPGTCLVSYEGYGNPVGQLSKNPSLQANYSFTGYWFVKRPNSQLSDDGTSKIQFDLLSSGYVLTHQKITRDEIYSSGNTINAWKTAVFDSGGSTRAMLGDSVDFNYWDPTQPNAYPLKIYTELGQHKAFFEHMQETQMGLQCEFCQKEYNDYVKAEGGAGKNPLGEAKSVGKHIYHESIRVYNLGSPMSGVPLRTWLYIPIKMALGAWDHPLDSSEIAQRWTKLPQQLYKNLTDWYTQPAVNPLFAFTQGAGRVWNSQLSFSVPGQDLVTYDTMTQDDRRIVGNRVQLTCPFQAEYDNQEWSAPIQDFADVNNMTFYISREGYPCFVPRSFRLRGIHTANGEGDWHMALGQSISSYSHDIDPDTLFTTAWITAQTAFGVEVSVASGGTSWDVDNQQWLWNSGKVGNKEGLHLTAGVQQVDTVSLDHLLLGFDWNTNPASTGIIVQRDGQLYQILKQPTLPTPGLSLGMTNHPTRVRMLRQVINFMVDRKYILIPAKLDDGDGAYDTKVAQGVAALQRFVNQQNLNSFGYRGRYGVPVNGNWDGYIHGAMQFFFTKGSEFINLDPWWWVINGFDWDAYVAHICGIIIPERKARGDQIPFDSTYIYDQAALKESQSAKAKLFHHMMFNVGNKAVDDSINKATVRQVNTNTADPRVQIGDIIWLEVDGYQSSSNIYGDKRPPFTNGMYVTNLTRSMDLQNGTYTGNYSGYRFRGVFGDLWAQNNEVYYGF